MKIYPCNHNIKTITDSYVDTDLNIPLSYITVDYTKYKIEKKINESFNTDKKTIILPGQEFDNINTKIFNQYNEEINTDNIFKTKNDKYIYSPNNLIEFEPKRFLWRTTIKKNQEYKISNTYNINLAASSTSLAERMSLILSNPSERSLLPPNIKINNNDVSNNTFIDVDMKDTDFTFIETPNCIYYDSSEEKIDINDYFDYNTNVWMFCKDAIAFNSNYQMLTTEQTYTFEVKNPLIHSNVKINTNNYFDMGLIPNTDGITYHNIFNEDRTCPILIAEYENRGFLIVSHYSISRDIEQYKDVIYEILMYIFLHSYKTSDYIKEWISLKVPDYEVINGTLTPKKTFTSNTNIANYFKISSSDYSVSNINIINDTTQKIALSDNDLASGVSFINCIGKNNDRLMFETNIDANLDGYTEPDKPIGWISIYYNGKIYYLNDLHYLIETDISDLIYLIETDDNLSVQIYGFKSSSLGINIENNTVLTIPFIRANNEVIDRIREAEYVIYILNGHIDYCFLEDYDSSIENQHVLFNIIVGQTDDSIETFDIRQLGGGLPEDEEDNYNLFDIGHINGRPYRTSGTLIITLPKKYEIYESIIRNIINKYITAEDYAVILFEDEDKEE